MGGDSIKSPEEIDMRRFRDVVEYLPPLKNKNEMPEELVIGPDGSFVDAKKKRDFELPDEISLHTDGLNDLPDFI